MVRERNKEIEAIIEKLSDETHSTQKTLMAQYEDKVKKMENKHRAEAEEYQTRLQQLKDKHLSEHETKNMLDDNLRVLTRRMNDLEIELADKKDKIQTMERAHASTKAELSNFNERSEQVKSSIENQYMQALDEKDAELRKIREELQKMQHRHE